MAKLFFMTVDKFTFTTNIVYYLLFALFILIINILCVKCPLKPRVQLLLYN